MVIAGLTQDMLGKKEALAKQAAANAYCPYSCFQVGTAILGDDDHIYTGCNVENAAYGSTICAECTAIGRAVTAGVKTIKAVLIYTPTEHHTFPCGNCRQTLNEFATDIPVYLSCDQKSRYHTTLKALLPDSFDPADLAQSPAKESCFR